MYSLQKVVPVSKGGIVLLPDSAESAPLQRPTYGVEALYNLPTYLGSAFREQCPNAANLSEGIIQFRVGAKNDNDVEVVIDRISGLIDKCGVEREIAVLDEQ